MPAPPTGSNTTISLTTSTNSAADTNTTATTTSNMLSGSSAAPMTTASSTPSDSTATPAISPHLLAVQQLRSVLSQLTSVAESADHVATLESKVSEYSNLLDAANRAEKKYVTQISTLEKQLAEAQMTAIVMSKKKSSNAADMPSQHHPSSQHHHSSASGHSSTTGSTSSILTPPSSSTAANYLATQYHYPSQFEANLSHFLAEHVDDAQIDDSEWIWADFPPPASSMHDLSTNSSASQSSTAPLRVLTSSTVDKMLKLHAAQPTQLFTPPRLGIGLELGFSQFHQLVYLQAAASQMQLQ